MNNHHQIPVPVGLQEISRKMHILMALSVPLVLMLGFVIVYATASRITLFVWMNDFMQGLPNWFWANVTFLADAGALLGLAGLCLLRKERMVYAAIIGGILVAVLIRLLKLYFDEPRPPAVLNGALFEVIGQAYRGKAFPSGHASTAFFISGLIVAFWRSKSIYFFALAFGVLASLSRVAVGVHWPTDILVGGAIGWLIGYSSGAFFHDRAYFGYVKRILVFLISYIAAVFLIVYDPNMPHVMWLQALIAALGVFGSLYYLAFRIVKV